jgi:LytS/YehU family sensor histidine kinase
MLLVIALVLGTTVGSVVVMSSGSYGDWPPVWGLMWGGLIALVYFKRRRDEELAAVLHATHLSQVELKKKALESQLQLMQGQVEPQFLFTTLRRVGDLYETDRSSADGMLDDLILYLRAALPQMRTSTSTLGQEIQLARAYMNIERVSARDRLDFAFDVPDRLVIAAFPPMVLLPLIEAFALRGRNAARDGEVLRVEACADAGTLKLTLTVKHPPAAQPSRAGVENIRSRLSALYGAEGKLRLERLNPHGTVVTMELPHVAT